MIVEILFIVAVGVGISIGISILDAMLSLAFL